MSKVIVGMSGGVDSSVTAYLLKRQGYDVEGISFILFETRGRKDPRACCSLEAINNAFLSAQKVGIPHSAVDLRDEFIEYVIEPFIKSYVEGKTPNPCILCNLYIKFPYLLKEADKRGAEFIATGHYARVLRTKGECYLQKGVDPSKDQSYFLYVLDKATLRRLLLPLGEYKKEDVRNLARSLELPSAKRPESVEICFVENRDYSSLIRTIAPDAVREGPIIGPDGSQIGTHDGVFNYTIGQRRGLNIAYSEPLYVARIDAEHNTIYVNTRDRLFTQEVSVDKLNWIGAPGLFRNTTPPEQELKVTAKVRSMMQDEPATLYPESSRWKLVFDEPQWPPAPGQAAVFYHEDFLIGGGEIQQS
ncbi:MAG: tRNA 2-thiouridine(34) synthase MnmA [Nitrospirae bacterium]|nr:tRNA 2-thiouridine(34) synthase MnmA [Nitrospirota bacterium]